MKLMRRISAVVLSLVMLITAVTINTISVSAEDVVEGLRWFPVPVYRQNDEAWEVECVRDGCLCQRFDDDPSETGNFNFLDTVYTANGGLTLTRNGYDYIDGNYWPRVRTLWLETAPEVDLRTANTVYFDFTVEEGTGWNIMISINTMGLKLSKVISDAAGVSGVANSDADGIAGTYKGSFNIWDAIDDIAKEGSTESGVSALAIRNAKKTTVTQLQIFVVGDVGASLTMNKFYISTASDTSGANCSFVDMGLLSGLGDDYYEIVEGDDWYDDDWDESPEDTVPTLVTTSKTTTTTKTTTTKKTTTTTTTSTTATSTTTTKPTTTTTVTTTTEVKTTATAKANGHEDDDRDEDDEKRDSGKTSDGLFSDLNVFAVVSIGAFGVAFVAGAVWLILVLVSKKKKNK